MRAVFQVLLAALREIFDEGPYARFLASHRLPASAASYRLFLEQRFDGRPRRCC
jgi:hypothetical protein